MVILLLLCPTAAMLGYTNTYYEIQSVLFPHVRYRRLLKGCANMTLELSSAIRLLIPNLF